MSVGVSSVNSQWRGPWVTRIRLRVTRAIRGPWVAVRCSPSHRERAGVRQCVLSNHNIAASGQPA